ncbi:MAG TPA: haloacid dehalogenase-like hydrolase [Myxococcota bacterium]|nr:haloacid dehalogenase-like hydrolase [Myxococcota bacterium]HRY92001.1 haloacid dehalogenase-like hydrolase [Myxococcota bacterium]HSA22676.1 haloacid dehalogenase-like hydrolase [Myxococcota bacterium]
MVGLWLFDIDGTLMLSGGAGLRALERAFLELYDLPDAMRGVECDGMTDPAIVRKVLQPRGLDTDTNIGRTLEAYLAHLDRTLAEVRDGVRVLPGVRDCLRFLAARPEVCLGLATGNVEPGARLKLEAVGLLPHFPFGGFGSDAEPRAELVKLAMLRGRLRTRQPAAPAVVLGDTPRDVLAAHAAGALAVGVAAAGYPAAALVQAGADLVLDSLALPELWYPRVAELLAARQALGAAGNPDPAPAHSPGCVRPG